MADIKEIGQKLEILKERAADFQKLCEVMNILTGRFYSLTKGEAKHITEDEISYINKLYKMQVDELNNFIEKEFKRQREKDAIEFQKTLDDISAEKRKRQNILTDLRVGKSYKIYEKININNEYMELPQVKVLGIYKKFILVKNSQFKETILKNDLICGNIKVKELKG